MSNLDENTISGSGSFDGFRSALREPRRASRVSGVLRAAYRLRLRFLRKSILWAARRLEGGVIHSVTVRQILRRFHDVEVGAYSYGPILKPGVLPRGSRVGSYCSVAARLVVHRRDHPFDRLTQSPLFYNHRLGYVAEGTFPTDESNPLTIGHDVWIGDRVTILSGCRRIGNGAVVAAGAVLTQDVAPYHIVGGVPARVIKKRFDDEIASRIERSCWWELPVGSLLPHLSSLTRPVDHATLDALGIPGAKGSRKHGS